MVATPLPLANCPTRRSPMAYPCSHKPKNAPDVKLAAQTDYGGSAGTASKGDQAGPWPKSAALTYDWKYLNCNGAIHQKSAVRLSKILDGSASTYLLIERYINPDQYESGNGTNNNENLYAGHDNDTLTWTVEAPLPDTAGVNSTWGAGSRHPKVFLAALCDSSVRMLSFDIDPTTHKNLGSRNDKKTVYLED